MPENIGYGCLYLLAIDAGYRRTDTAYIEERIGWKPAYGFATDD